MPLEWSRLRGGAPKHILCIKGQWKIGRISLWQHDVKDQEKVFLSCVNSYPIISTSKYQEEIREK